MSILTKLLRNIVLLLLVSFAMFLGLLITPALPQIAIDFGISETKTQWIVSIFLIGYTIGQLPYGPIANRFGRKHAITIGAVLAVIGSLMAYFSTDFRFLCVARFIQALGSGVGLKIAFTMVGDLYVGDAATKAIAMLTIAFGIMPGVATAVGGYITVAWGWHGGFIFLAAYSVLLWLACMLLPETAKTLDKEALHVDKIWHGLSRQFKDPFLMLHALLLSLAKSFLYIFATIAPYMAIDRIGLKPEQFGLWSMVPAFGLVTGSLACIYLTGKFNPRLNMLSGMLMTLVGTIILSACFFNHFVNTWTLFLPIYVILTGTNLTWSNSLSKALSEATDKSNASAVLQFINMGVPTLCLFLLEVVPPTTVMLLPTVFTLLLILMFFTWFALKPHHEKSSS